MVVAAHLQSVVAEALTLTAVMRRAFPYDVVKWEQQVARWVLPQSVAVVLPMGVGV